METQEVTQHESIYEPTSEQTRRAEELRRFNLLYVYVPLGLLTVITVTIVVILLLVAVNPPSAESVLFLSGLADVALIIAMLPVIVLGAAILGLIGYAYSQARRSGMAPIRQTQRLLWRMDNVMGRVRVSTEQTAGSLIRPFLSVNGALTYIRVLITQLIRLVKRS